MTDSVKNKVLIPQNDMKSYNLDTVILCLGLLIIGTFINGSNALFQSAVCAVSSLVSEYTVFSLILKKKNISYCGTLAEGLLISLLLPSSAPFYIGALACAFSVFVAVLPFGDRRNSPFVPAAAGFCFVAVLFPAEVFSYGTLQGVFYGDELFIKGTTLLDMLCEGATVRLNTFGISSLISGSIPGATGTTSVMALVGVFLYRLIRKPSSLISSVGFLCACVVFICLFPGANAGIVTVIVNEICAGSLLFTALMLICDPVTVPSKKGKAFVYGILAGIISMLLRRYGNVYDGSVFSVMIINCLSPVIFGETVSDKIIKEIKTTKKSKLKKKFHPVDSEPIYNILENVSEKEDKDDE